MVIKLKSEIFDVYKKIGFVICKKEELYKIVIVNVMYVKKL